MPDAWQMVWQVLQLMESRGIESNSRIFCLATSALERHTPDQLKPIYYQTLLR